MPTLSFPSAGPALPLPIAINPIAAAPGSGEGDAFAAMLAGLSSLPAAESAPPPAATLPEVRQDPAAWLPDEDVETPLPVPGALPAATPGLSESPKSAVPLVFGPDCEMPAEMDGPPLQPPVRASLPATVLPPATKGWALRLTSALTPTGLAVAEPETGEAQAPERIAVDPTKAPPEGQAPVSIVVAPEPVTIDLPAPATAPAPVLREAEIPLERPAAAAADLSGRAPQTLPASTPQQPATSSAPEAAPAPAAQPAASPTGVPLPQAANAPALAPELMKQVARAIDAVRSPSDPATPAQAEPTVLTSPQPAQPIVAQPLPAPTATAQPGVAPAPAPTVVQLAPVDLGRAEWVQAMIDRIAELPQAEGGREAQIRLAPDALGKVEVTIVQRDEQTQVTLNAETAQARQLLSDAAPRLQELAEARGLRLAHTEVGGGQPQDRRSHQEQQHPQTPQRPRPASAGSGDDPQPKGDLIA